MAYNINPFQTNVSLLYPLKHQKTAGSWWFLVVGELNGFMFSRGIEVEHLYRKARGSNNACPNASPHFFTKTIKLLRVFSQDLFYFLNICYFCFFFWRGCNWKQSQFHRTTKVSNHLTDQTFGLVEIKRLLFAYTNNGFKVSTAVSFPYHSSIINSFKTLRTSDSNVFLSVV